ncbi:MAG: DivIVA domain-containing protein [Trueperella sp.]|nr:DivIVA domain-containing protein [Trueperella sp.]
MTDTFARAGKFSSGYDVAQVDSFLTAAKAAYGGENSEDIDETTVRNTAFSWVRNGYDPALVDAALDRLERAFIQRRRAKVVNTDGEAAWLDQTYAAARTLYPRLLRPAGERFADASDTGYKKAEVDELLDTVAKYFDGKAALTSDEVRQTVFSSAKKTGAYAEEVVDVYLDRVISVLLAVE